MPNYRRNEDKWPVWDGIGQNHVIDVNALDGTVLVPIPVEPVSLAEVKLQTRIDFADDDVYLSALITQCRGLMERVTKRSLVEKTVTAIIRNEIGGMELPWGPVKSITTVTNRNLDVLVVNDTYKVEGLLFPVVTQPTSDYVTFVYTAGHTAANMPVGLKQALLELIAYKYRHRGDEDDQELSRKVNQLSAPFKRGSWLL